MRIEEREAPPGSFGELGRHIVAVGLAGLAAGFLVGGLGGRVFMRIAAAAASPLVQGATTEAGASIGEIAGRVSRSNDAVRSSLYRMKRLLLEEVDSIDISVPAFSQYIEIVTAMLADAA